MDNLQTVMARQSDLFSQLVTEIRAAGTDNLSFFGNGYTHEGGLTLQQNPFEFAAAVVFLSEQFIRPGSQAYLEIGSASGGACRFLCEKLKFRTAWVIDDHGHHRWPEQRANFDATQAAGCSVHEWIGDSHSAEAAAWIDANLSHLPDLSFIDGDHSGPGCWADFDMVYKLLRSGKGGDSPSHRLVMFHDIVACEGVKQSWEQACQSGMLTPLAAYIGPGTPGTNDRPLGIGIGRVG